MIRSGMRSAALLLLVAGVLSGCGVLQKSDRELADEALLKGIASQNSGNISDARVQFFTVLAHDPANKFAFYNLGQIARNQQKYAIAEGYYRQALETDADYSPAIFGLAFSRATQSGANPQESIDLYRRVTTLDPNNAAAHYNLGLLLRVTGQVAAGDAEVARAIQLDRTLVAPSPIPSVRPSASPSPAR